MNIRVPGRPSGTLIGTKNSTSSSENTALVTMTTKYPPALSRTEIESTVVISKQAVEGSRLSNTFTNIEDTTSSECRMRKDEFPITAGVISDHEDVPRCFQYPRVPRVQQNVRRGPVQSQLAMVASMNPLPLQERHRDSTSRISNDDKNIHVAKENICPNTGNSQSAVSLHSQSDHSLLLLPIPLSSRIAGCFEPCSEKQARKDGQSNIPYVNYSRSPECSKHIFVAQPNEAVQSPLINKASNSSLLHKPSSDYAELWDYVKDQEKRMNLLEREAAERNIHVEELAETNSNLNARVMVLETAVALLQEKLDS